MPHHLLLSVKHTTLKIRHVGMRLCKTCKQSS